MTELILKHTKESAFPTEVKGCQKVVGEDSLSANSEKRLGLSAVKQVHRQSEKEKARWTL